MFTHKQKSLLLIVALVALLAILGAALLPAAAQSPVADDQIHDVTEDAYARLMDVDGKEVGTIHFVEQPDAVAVMLRLEGMEPGFHGVHIHSSAACDAVGETPFASAGGHWNPDNLDHPNHDGDLLPVLVMADGTGAYDFLTDRFRVEELFDDDGSAVIVHAGTDNFDNSGEGMESDAASLASGNAGERQACGVVERGDLVLAETLPAHAELTPEASAEATEEAMPPAEEVQPTLEPTMDMTPDLPTEEPTLDPSPTLEPTVDVTLEPTVEAEG